jgi:hypothetical protein
MNVQLSVPDTAEPEERYRFVARIAQALSTSVKGHIQDNIFALTKEVTADIWPKGGPVAEEVWK